MASQTALALRAWRINHTMPIVLTTACVRLADEDLNAVFKLGRTLLPSDCAEELSLLAAESRIPAFRRRADRILRSSARTSWSLHSAPECAVFVFAQDPVEAESFAALTAKTLPQAAVCLSRWRPAPASVIPVTSVAQVLPERKERVRRIQPEVDQLFVGGKRLAPEESGWRRSGSYGEVFRLADGRLAKLLRYGPAAGSFLRKLELMRDLNLSLPPAQRQVCALPLDLVYDRAERCVGFTMNSCGCKTLAEHLAPGGKSMASLRALMRSVMLVTLELRLCGVTLRDISLRNFTIREDGTACAIDLDSAQLLTFSGGRATAEFASPRLRQDKLLSPEEQSFALAALCFYAFSGTPVYGYGQAEERVFSLPRGEGRYSDSCRSWWQQLSPEKRAVLSAWFDGTAPVSIGLIINLFEMH